MTDRRWFLQRSAALAAGALVPLAPPSRGSSGACLVEVHINPEMRVKVARGPARAVLAERSWRSFLVRLRNEAGTTAALRVTSPHRWLDLQMADDSPLTGQEHEYRMVRLRSWEAGRREASLAFDVGQGTQDLGFRNEVPILFDCRASLTPQDPDP